MAKASTDRPNILVFFTDQQRWDSTGVHGNPLELTPNFDRMAAQGTHVRYSFTCQPVCGPARSCLQMGQYATTTGCFRNHIPMRPDARTMAHSFNDAGYQTGYIGKWHLYDGDVFGPVPPEHRGGYQYWLAANTLEFTSGPYDTNLWDSDNREVKLPGYRVDAIADATIRYLDQHQDGQPFFLFTSYIEPHHQNSLYDYVPPDGYRQRYTGRWIPPDLAGLGNANAHRHLGGYWGMVKRLDEALGRVLDALKSLDLLDNTIVLFTSDHGCHLETRNSEAKRSCHESSIRVPTAFRGPGFDGAGQVQQLVSLVDLSPTLLDAAGIDVPGQMQGRSIIPLLRGQSADWPAEAFVQISESQVGRAVRTHRWKYSVQAPGKVGHDDPDSDYYVEEFLYDLDADPYELSNLASVSSHADVRADLRDRLIRRMVEAGEQAPTIAPLDPTPPGQLAPPADHPSWKRPIV